MLVSTRLLRRVALLACGLLILGSGAHADEALTGVGSSAAHPVYRSWAEQYARAGGPVIAYDPAGSSAGLRAIRARASDFGASDVAPTLDDRALHDLVVIPTVITGVVPVINLPGVASGQLVVDGELLAAIFSGAVTHWNDPLVQRLNPGLALPATAIKLVVRADGSGTTYNFSDYLAKVSSAWKEGYGVDTRIEWPQGALAAKGNKGVALTVLATAGSIGYVDYNYVQAHGLNATRMRLADGTLIEARPRTFRSALMQSKWLSDGDFNQTLTARPGRCSWPITMGTFVVMPRVADDPERAREIIRFFTWAFMNGDQLASQVNFVRLPDNVQAKAYRAMAEIRDRDGNLVETASLMHQIARRP